MRKIVVVISVACASILAHGGGTFMGSKAYGAGLQFDVNDISYLWPVPVTLDDVSNLIQADEPLADGTHEIWPKELFEKVLAAAHTASVTNSAGRLDTIDFSQFADDFAQRSTWKIVAFRVDPSAPGSTDQIRATFGSVPQIRVILQPVTTNGAGAFKVHDLTAHLVFNYVTAFEPPSAAGAPPRAIPDKVAFAAIIDDLKSLKLALRDAGVATEGKLTVHPGLKAKVSGFSQQVKSFLTKHLSADHLAAIAFMGLEPPEPWIFFAMTRRDGDLLLAPHPSLNGKSSQLLTFRGGTHVMPIPITRNIDGQRGVSTSVLFSNNAADKLNDPAVDGQAAPQLKDIPDIIANPQRAHFFNTDCVSCHSESSRRKELNINVVNSAFQFVVPDGISGVDQDLLPKDQWNVRNFGWFPLGGPVATVTMRTANETAAAADFINKEYLSQTK